MKKVLCFGDSNVYGFNPENGTRYDKNSRWSGILGTLAQEKFEIFERGCNNRTCFSENPAGENFTGVKILPEILKTKFNYIILALGINDLQKSYNPGYEEIKEGLERLIKIAQNTQPEAEIILASPSVISLNILKSFFGTMFDKGSIEKSHKLAQIYTEVAQTHNCHLIDFNKIAQTSELDGLHYSPSEHQKIAEAMFKFLQNVSL